MYVSHVRFDWIKVDIHDSCEVNPRSKDIYREIDKYEIERGGVRVRRPSERRVLLETRFA